MLKYYHPKWYAIFFKYTILKENTYCSNTTILNGIHMMLKYCHPKWYTCVVDIATTILNGIRTHDVELLLSYIVYT